MNFEIRPLEDNRTDIIRSFWLKLWAGDSMVVHDQVYHPEDLSGFVAVQNGLIVGLVTYVIAGQDCEVISLDSLAEGQGVGTALLKRIEAAAACADCERIWLVTTNDNLPALRFYHKRGYQIKAIHAGAVDRARRIKAGIPQTGLQGIPLHDEIELEKVTGWKTRPCN